MKILFRISLIFFSILNIFSSCTEEKRDAGVYAKCSFTIAHDSRFVLCTQFREPIDTIILEHDINGYGLKEWRINDYTVKYQLSGIDLIFDNLTTFDDLDITLVNNDIDWIYPVKTGSNMIFENFEYQKISDLKCSLLFRSDSLKNIKYIYGNSADKYSMLIDVRMIIRVFPD